MTSGDEIRAAREAKGMSQDDLARAVGLTQPSIVKIESGRTVRSKYLPEIRQQLNIEQNYAAASVAAVDGPVHYKALPIIVDAINTIPLFASAEGGEGALVISAEEIDRVPRPYTLEHVKEAYAILIEGESMDPAFEPGDIAWVNPQLGARRNHDVILYGSDRVDGEARALIKRIVSATDENWTVRQYNPPKQFSLSRAKWGICHRVVGKLSKR